MDITHYRGGVYLSMIDCGPGRLAIWRELHAESASAVAEELEKVMLECNGGDNGQWHCFLLRNFPDNAKKMEDKKLLQGSL